MEEVREKNEFFDLIEDPVSRKLIETLAQLMEKRPLEEIPTSEVIRLSGVGRSTFYRRFRDKYDLLTRCYQELLDRTLAAVPRGLSFRESFFSLYRTLASQPAFFRRALATPGPEGLRSYIFNQSFATYSEMLTRQGMDLEDTVNRLKLIGYITGALEVTCIWADTGMKLSLEEMFRITFELMPYDIQMCLALNYL